MLFPSTGVDRPDAAFITIDADLIVAEADDRAVFEMSLIGDGIVACLIPLVQNPA